MAEGSLSSEMISPNKQLKDGLLPHAVISLVARRTHTPLAEAVVPKKRSVLKESVKYVLANFSKGINVDDMAQAAGLSKFHFIRKFHREAGITPGAFLRRFRIVRAMELLLDSDRSVCDIAREVGYSNASVFCRAFLRTTKTEPHLYRHTHCRKKKPRWTLK